MAVSGGTAMAERLATGEAQALRSSSKLHRSRGVARARGLLPVCPRGGGSRFRGDKPPQNARGTARRAARPVRLFTPASRPAWRLSARRRGDFSPWRRASRRRPGGYFVPPIRAASAALRLRHVQPLKAGPRSGAGRLARASRVRGQRTHARGRRPCPRDRRNRFASPRGQGDGEYKPSLARGDKFFEIGAIGRCYSRIRRG